MGTGRREDPSVVGLHAWAQEPWQRVKCKACPSTQLAAGRRQAGSRPSAQLAPSGSCAQWMPVFMDTAAAFVHSSPKHQLEGAGRGRGLHDADMAEKQPGLFSSGRGPQGRREAAPDPLSPLVPLPGPVAGTETTPKTLWFGWYSYLLH